MGRLTITWSASDKNLSVQPIALSYSEGPEGPWKPIAQNLPNDGKYVWMVPENHPFQFYVRVEATDMAKTWAWIRPRSPSPSIQKSRRRESRVSASAFSRSRVTERSLASRQLSRKPRRQLRVRQHPYRLDNGNGCVISSHLLLKLVPKVMHVSVPRLCQPCATQRGYSHG